MSTASPPILARWQTTTAVCLFVGYCGYYLCRSNLAVAAPGITEEFGLDKGTMGQLAALGVVAYSLGKFVNGILGDLVGGKRVFVLGMVASVVATVAFTLGTGPTMLFVAWGFNRLVQSMGWGGLVKVTANWFSYRAYGRIMGLLSLSYMVGDVLARLLLGQLQQLDFQWRTLFYVAAALLAAIAAGNALLLRDKPEALGLPAPEASPHRLQPDADGPPVRWWELLLPYFRNRSFLLILGMSFGLTGIREVFNFWMPTYLYDTAFAHLTDAAARRSAASQWSALFQVFGGLSIVGVGFLSDGRLGGRRGGIIAAGCVLCAAVLFLMSAGLTNPTLPFVFIALAGLALLGPYSFLAGAMSLDAGGRQGAATAAGLVDSVGYAGATLSLWLTGRVAQQAGWNRAFLLLAGLAALTALTAVAFYRTQERGKTV